MTLPLMLAGTGYNGGWRCAGSALLVLLAVGVMSGPGRAQDTDPFTATVAVDATANTAAQAREMARTDGQRRALAAVAERARAKLPKLDDKAITDLVASFEVANERMSAVRYAGDYTFHFRPEETRRILGNPAAGNAGPVAPAEPGKPVVLIPVYQSAGPARAGDGGALAAIARRNGADEALVALAQTRGPPDRPAGLDVTVKRYRGDRLVDSHAEPLTANPGESESELLRRAAAAIVSGIASGWKSEAVARYDQEGSLTAILPITDLDDWVRARERLVKVPAVRKVALMALSRQEATIEIGYLGSIDQLKAGLAGISLDLVRGDPVWQLARSGSGRGP